MGRIQELMCPMQTCAWCASYVCQTAGFGWPFWLSQTDSPFAGCMIVFGIPSNFLTLWMGVDFSSWIWIFTKIGAGQFTVNDNVNASRQVSKAESGSQLLPTYVHLQNRLSWLSIFWLAKWFKARLSLHDAHTYEENALSLSFVSEHFYILSIGGFLRSNCSSLCKKVFLPHYAILGCQCTNWVYGWSIKPKSTGEIQEYLHR